MNNEFINQNDPTKLLDLSGVSIENQYSQLSERDKLLVFCKLRGLKMVPPSIEQLYQDDYYLGGPEFFNGGKNIYEYWKDKLHMIFPTPVTISKNYIVLKSAIGTGKSLMSRIILANNYARLLCMTNPSETLHLTPKPISFVVGHRDVNVADNEWRYWFTKEVLKKSPFFKNVTPNFKFQFITSGARKSPGLGSDCLVYIYSEVEFLPNQAHAQDLIATALGRFTSRFDSRVTDLVGSIVIDSSPRCIGGPTDWFIDQMSSDKLWICKAAHFEVKPESYKESQGKTFSVWAGSGKYPPAILPEDYVLAEDQDPDRVIKVPIQLKVEAQMNLEKMLQDKCAVSTSADNLFFCGNIKPITQCFKTKSLIPELIEVDFFDKNQRILDKVYPAIKNVKPTSTIWLGLDLAVKSDICGISAVQFDGWEIISGVKWPRVKTLFTIGITRKEGQETSLFHIFNFIMDLKKDYNVIVSADQAYSKQILQDCEREGIKTNGRISTDNTPDNAIYLKNLILLGLIEIPENRRLLREAYDLKYVPTQKGWKIDHPSKATQNSSIFDVNDGRGSKDIWDSLTSCTASLKMSIDSGEEDGYPNGVNKQLEITKQLTFDSREEAGKKFQDMLQNIF